MSDKITGTILAVITLNMEEVSGGGAPIFFAPDEKIMENTALILAKILDASAHDLENGTFIIVRH